MLFLFVLAHFAHHLLTALPVPLIPLIRGDYGLDYTQSGLVVSAFSLSYGIGQLPAGWLADRVGAKAMITMGICGVAVAGFLAGLTQTYWLMIGCLILMGLLAGGYHPAAPPLIAASVEPGRMGRALGLHVIGGSASYFLAPLIGVAIAAAWGWRASFIGLAGPTIAFGVAFYVLLGRKAIGGQPKKSASEIRAPGSARRVNRRLVGVIVLSSLASAVIVSTISFIPLFLVDHFGLGQKTAGVLLSVLYSAGLWAAPLGGYISDRVGKIRVILAICGAAGPTIFLLTLAPHWWAVVPLLVLLGVSLSVRMPVSEAYIVQNTRAANRSTVLGIYYFSAMEGGGVLTPLVGYLIDRVGFRYAFTATGALLLAVTAVCAFWLWGEKD